MFKLLTEANEEGDKLTRDEVVAMVLLLVVAGHETTAYTLSSSMYHLLNNPQELDLLRTDPSVYPTAIEELLRYDAAARHTVARWAIQDVVLGDVTIRKGETVFGSLQAADHDPAVFDNPLKLDLRRHPNPHIAFGWGAHLCVGAPLARLELELALRAILDRTTMVALASDGVEWRDSFTIRGPRRLPLEWDLE